METTEKIVEAYVRYIKGWFTLPNIKCSGQNEIDLLAVDLHNGDDIRRYHIESGISISGAYSPLTNKPFSLDNLRVRTKAAEQRRTLGFFIQRKFNNPNVLNKLKTFGFRTGNYSRVIVSWDWKEDVPAAADSAGIELWNFKRIILEISDKLDNRTYFQDDTMRTLQLMSKAILEEKDDQ